MYFTTFFTLPSSIRTKVCSSLATFGMTYIFDHSPGETLQNKVRPASSLFSTRKREKLEEVRVFFLLPVLKREMAGLAFSLNQFLKSGGGGGGVNKKQIKDYFVRAFQM
jgi:hypothetical protein